MKLCIPVQGNKGLDSKVSMHFGSAPFFLLVDSETSQFELVENHDEHHAHGMCHPVGALNGASVDAVVVGGIGRRAIEGLNAAGIKVYRSSEGSAQHILDAAVHETLEEMTADGACAGHSNGCSSP
ncbi:NifB/NifX family molybdenum-iron cluster-binding protein [Candidatus Bipolaricaulota bacterium]